MSVSTLQALQYLEQLPGTVHKRLYQQPSAALAVFRRMLPHLGELLVILWFCEAEQSLTSSSKAKHIVMGMLYMPTPFAATDLDAWLRPDAKAYVELHLVREREKLM